MSLRMWLVLALLYALALALVVSLPSAVYDPPLSWRQGYN